MEDFEARTKYLVRLIDDALIGLLGILALLLAVLALQLWPGDFGSLGEWLTPDPASMIQQ